MNRDSRPDAFAAATVVELAPPELRCRTQQLVDLLADAIDGGASVNYVIPYRRDDLEAYWSRVEEDVANGSRVVLVILEDDRVMGSVQLVPSRKPNQPHRADVEKLLVHSSSRRRGAGTALMSAVECAARDRGRWLLTLDTRSDSTADVLYPRWGWHAVGRIPDYALDPDGKPAACTFYWKRLA
jgi:GNAT superfamily N-acetyltransferase